MSGIETVDGVTYQDGHAIEQDGGSDGPEEGSEHANELEAAKEAVRKAIKGAGEDAAAKAKEKAAKKPTPKSDREPDEDDEPAAEAKPETKEPKKAEKKEEESEEIDLETASVKQILKQREKLAKQKQAQSLEIQQQQAQLQAYMAQIERERQAIEHEKQRIARLRKDPLAAIREAGWDPDDLILNLAQEGTPEGKMARMLREQQEKLQAFEQWKAEQAQQAQRAQEEAQLRYLAQQRQQVEQAFVNGATDEKAYPHIAKFYKGREAALIAEGDIVAHEFRVATGGREATLQQIADYIEEQLAERAKLWYESKQGAGNSSNTAQQVVADAGTGKPARGSAKGKTLTGTAASERRALGKDLSDLDGDERLQAAREAVKVAMASARDE